MNASSDSVPGSPPSGAVESTLRIYGVVLSIGLCCSLAIVGTYEFTRPIIQQNRLVYRQKAIVDLLPETKRVAAYAWDASLQTFAPVTADQEIPGVVFAAFDLHDRLIGIALETQGMGYQDLIRLMYAFEPEHQEVTGIRVLESRETPGLGDRIETDERFLGNFVHLDVALTPDGRQLAHEIEFAKPGSKQSAWQIDGITGATISSRATSDMLRKSTSLWIPRIHRCLQDFTAPDLIGEGLAGQDLTGQDLTGQDLTGQDLTGQDLTGQDLTGQDLTGQDEPK